MEVESKMALVMDICTHREGFGTICTYDVIGWRVRGLKASSRIKATGVKAGAAFNESDYSNIHRGSWHEGKGDTGSVVL